MGRILIGFFVLIVAVIALALIAPAFIPTDVYRAQIEERAEAALGRELTIGGDVSLRLIPSVQMQMNEVAIANADWGTADRVAAMERLDVGLKLFPLIGGTVEVERFVLIGPEINLETAADGRVNWTFGTGAASPAPEASESAPDSGSAPAAGSSPIEALKLGDVRLQDGKITYRDGAAGTVQDISGIDAVVDLPALDAPFALRGDATYQGKEMSVDIALDNLAQVLEGARVPARLSAKSDDLTFSFDGDIQAAGSADAALPYGATGTLDLDIPSVPALFAWLGTEGGIDGLDTLNISGALDSGGNRLAVNNARLAFNDTVANGQMTVGLGGAKPFVSGRLSVDDTLDLRPFMGGPSTTEGAAAPAAADTGPAAGWSDEPLDLSALKTVNADLTFTAQEIVTETLTVGPARLIVKITDGILDIALEQMDLYEGTGVAFLTLDASGRQPALSNRIKFDAVDALPLLRDMNNINFLRGIGNLEWNVTSTGASPKALVSNLNGTGVLKFTDGAIQGVNLPGLFRDMRTAITTLQFDRTTQETDFSRLESTFTIENGVMNTDGLLINPLLELTGKGVVGLVDQTLHYRLVPQKMSRDGSGTPVAVQVGEFDVPPLIISGTWDNLRFAPDMEGLGRSLLSGVLGNQAKGLFGAEGGPGGGTAGALGAIVEGLAGGTQAEGEEQSEPKTPEDTARGLIRGLLDQRRKKDEEKEPPKDGDAPPPGAP